MMPALLWLEYVLGFQRLWDVQFHTRDVARFELRDGSGLRSVVMWESALVGEIRQQRAVPA
jgi:4-hydroxyphenylpyruvate dioxygenase